MIPLERRVCMYCEDYPCCGHGSTGDGGACPDSSGRFPCEVVNGVIVKVKS